jgi:RNA polymerase sigma-70 factor, ECF subfamily
MRNEGMGMTLHTSTLAAENLPRNAMLQAPLQVPSRAGLAVLSFQPAHNLRLVVTPAVTSPPGSLRVAPGAERGAAYATAPDAVAPHAAAHDTCTADSNQRLAALLAASAQGDARAFEEFYTLTMGAATAVARRLVGANYLEDVLSDAYFQAWQQAVRFDGQRGSALTWLLTICRSRALDRLRAEKIRHDGQTGAPEFEAEALADEVCPGPETLLESTQSASHLHAALAQLSANERWVLGLAYFRDLSHAEIASLTLLPLGTVKSLINRSQRKLREALPIGAPA